MELTVEALVPSPYLPARIDLPRGGNNGPGEVNRAEYPPTQQEGVGLQPRILANGIGIGPADLPAGVDPEGDSANCPGEVNRTEYAPAQQEAVGLPIHISATCAGPMADTASPLTVLTNAWLYAYGIDSRGNIVGSYHDTDDVTTGVARSLC